MSCLLAVLLVGFGHAFYNRATSLFIVVAC